VKLFNDGGSNIREKLIKFIRYLSGIVERPAIRDNIYNIIELSPRFLEFKIFLKISHVFFESDWCFFLVVIERKVVC
jgi:hypothetical protein